MPPLTLCNSNFTPTMNWPPLGADFDIAKRMPSMALLISFLQQEISLLAFFSKSKRETSFWAAGGSILFNTRAIPRSISSLNRRALPESFFGSTPLKHPSIEYKLLRQIFNFRKSTSMLGKVIMILARYSLMDSI